MKIQPLRPLLVYLGTSIGTEVTAAGLSYLELSVFFEIQYKQSKNVPSATKYLKIQSLDPKKMV